MVTNPARQAGLALRGCTVIDGKGNAPLADQTVLVAGDRIVNISAGGDMPAGYECLEVEGAYLLPGFINAHVHEGYDPANLRAWLAAGVTTVRDLNPHNLPEFLTVRDRVNADPTCARCVSSSPIITKTGGYGSLFVSDVEGARQATLRQIENGVDLIKIAIEDDLQLKHFPTLTPDEVKAIVDVAHARELRVSAHISHLRNVGPALAAGVDDISHMIVEPLPGDVIAQMVEQGVCFTPTLELWQGVSRAHGINWDETTISNLARFHRAGGLVALGTDFAGYFTSFDLGFPKTEVALMQRAGMTNMEIIVAATQGGAQVCGRAADLGTIEPGKIADLVVVEGNPLDDMRLLEHPLMVIHNGNVAVDNRRAI